MDLSKVFYTINHDFLITKLESNEFSNNALQARRKKIKSERAEKKPTSVYLMFDV